MTLDEIKAEWEVDCVIDPLMLTEETIKTPILHKKYSDIRADEGKVLTAMRGEYERMKVRFMIHYSNPKRPRENPDNFLADIERNIALPRTKGMMEVYRDGDKTVTEYRAKIGFQEEKVQYLDRILWQIKDRKDQLSLILRERIFESGG